MCIVQLYENECPICYTSELQWHQIMNKSQIAVFKCNHFTCKNCYEKIKNNFKCPICRIEGQKHLTSFCKISDTTWNTLEDWMKEFHIVVSESLNANLSIIPNSSFGIIYINMIKKKREYIIQMRQNKMIEDIKNKKILNKKKKEYEKNIAICSKCGTTCNSLYQLKKHENNYKCIKLALKHNFPHS